MHDIMFNLNKQDIIVVWVVQRGRLKKSYMLQNADQSLK